MHDFSLLNYPAAPGILLALTPILLLAIVWTVVLKGFALWHAARNGQKEWFVALLIVNTLGVLEIVYLLWFRPKPSSSISTTPKVSSET